MTVPVPADAPFRILHVEDDAADAELIHAALAEGGLRAELHRVDTESDLLAALDAGGWELVLSDYALPRFNGAAALALVKSRDPDLPFIVVSGTLGEDAAIEMLRLGATDYILKDRPTRLAASIRRALAERVDRSRRREAEEALRKSEAQLRQSQKMEAIGRLASGVAHDFNNMLTAIMGHAELIRHRGHRNPRIDRDVDEILRAAESAAGLTRQLLTFSRKQSVDRRRRDLNGVVTGMSDMLRRLLGGDIELTTALAPDATHVDTEPNQVEQVLMNLVVNARDAMPQGGTIRIGTTRVDLAAPLAARSGTIPAGPYVVLTVADTGCGMDDEVMDRIFEPFFTTKEAGRGTGLGLSIVHGIITQNQGVIDVSSVKGSGTAFEVYLPMAAGAPHAATPSAPAASVPAGGGETILVVEDEEQVCRLVEDALDDAGYRVITAASRDEALRHFDGQRPVDPPIALVLSDTLMPGLSAHDFVETLGARGFAGGIVFMSGYLGASLPPPPAGRSAWPFLAKPFAIDALLGLVAATLGESRRAA